MSNIKISLLLPIAFLFISCSSAEAIAKPQNKTNSLARPANNDIEIFVYLDKFWNEGERDLTKKESGQRLQVGSLLERQTTQKLNRQTTRRIDNSFKAKSISSLDDFTPGFARFLLVVRIRDYVANRALKLDARLFGSSEKPLLENQIEKPGNWKQSTLSASKAISKSVHKIIEKLPAESFHKKNLFNIALIEDTISNTDSESRQGNRNKKSSYEKRLTTLKKLLSKGLITKKEYDKKRADIINKL